ncbi:hypothetical protein [Marinoscillum furvescens]|uniref:SiaC family regulatory phosphoprotein domain-containing protein n=1 Tax=Marinoscillum furvescens DSM 4134 TaxID=1122208 RepID=A0A3D9L0M5_MARFU|nr:hypothetical protein [Marinoscillum furvescens]RED97003.1 hypothetical protein C7460_11351 [Marinoscillum furvescens DSM 4134]
MESISLINLPTAKVQPQNSRANRPKMVEYHQEQDVLIIRDTSNLSVHHLTPVLEIVRHHLSRKESIKCFLYLKKIPGEIADLLTSVFEMFQGYDLQGRKILVSWFTKSTNFESIENNYSDPYGLNINLHTY